MGELITFYRPAPKPPVEEPVEEEEPGRMPAEDVLNGLLAGKHITDILVLLRDDAGTLGFVTNLADLPESLLFMERVRYRVMAKDYEQNESGPKGIA